MTRPLRVIYPGAWYHVMNRGTARQTIFHDDSHFKLFIELMSEAVQRFGIEIHAYCLMGNHYYLLIRTPQPNLSQAVRHIDGIYTQRYNKLMQTDGPLLRGRFKSILVEKDNYLLQLSRYIHLNPVKAMMCQHLSGHNVIKN
jgi:REP element-mobilizing transposase RayT